MDSPWPMKCHDLHHTGRSPYSTASNPDGVEKWRFYTESWNRGGVIIGDDDTIYLGNLRRYLYAINPNGTMKWKYVTGMWIWSSPAIGEDGTVYVGSYDAWLHAVNPDGTLKWKFSAGASISSSPAIGVDGTIYFGNMQGGSGYRIYAVNPDGTEKWHYQTGDAITSDPAIGDDGTIYISSMDKYIYAMNPNGTLRWRFKTGHYVKGPASIADDGTIYFGSCDGYLYALYPNGTMKWQSSVGSGTETNPSIANDGTIYVGGDALYAVYPNNGTRKWTFNLGSNRHIHQSSPAISADGTIYIGVNVGDRGAEILSVNPDGTEKWRKWVGDLEAQSSPCIGSDGTVYVGSSSMTQTGASYGYLHAFGRGELIADAGGPYNALINEDIQFSSTIWGGIPPYEYLWDFGDGDTSVDDNPVHSYPVQGNYSITLTVTDAENNVSVDTTMAYVRSPPSTPDIDGPASGHFGEEYDYTFTAVDPESDDIWYYVDWGDDSSSGWLGPYNSGEAITLSHIWMEEDTYTLRCRAKDTLGGVSEWGTLELTMPVNQHSYSFPLLQRFLERFPNMFPILRNLFEV
jgi:outer membrane protein assembly factor BamB